MNTSFYKKIRNQKGYTLLFSILIATLVLGVAVFILSVSTKQYQLSITARDSMYAVYAADAGLECAIASDGGGMLGAYGAVDTSTEARVMCNGVTSAPVNFAEDFCANFIGMDFLDDNTCGAWQAADMVVDLSADPSDKSCALITVTYGPDATTLGPKTIIDSRGYNICPGTPSSKSRIVERQLRLIRQ
jgi:hypothetical protein